MSDNDYMIQLLIETADFLSGKTDELAMEGFNPLIPGAFFTQGLVSDAKRDKKELSCSSKGLSRRRTLSNIISGVGTQVAWNVGPLAFLPAQIGAAKLRRHLMELNQPHVDGEHMSLDYVAKETDDVINNIKKEARECNKIVADKSLPRRKRDKANEELKALKIAYKKCLRVKKLLQKRAEAEKKKKMKEEAKARKKEGRNK